MQPKTTATTTWFFLKHNEAPIWLPRRREFLYKFFFSYVEIHIENECFPTPLAASMPLFSLVAPTRRGSSVTKNKKQNTEHTRPSLHCRNSTKYNQLHNSNNNKSSVYLLIDLINSLSWSATWQHKDFVEALGRSIRCGYHSLRLLRPVLPQFDPQIYQ